MHDLKCLTGTHPLKNTFQGQFPSLFHLPSSWVFFLLFLKCFHFYKRSMQIVHFVQYFVVRYVIVVLMSLLSLFCWNVCMCLNNCCLVSDSNPTWVLKLFFDFISVHRGLLKIFINYIVHVLFSNYKITGFFWLFLNSLFRKIS